MDYTDFYISVYIWNELIRAAVIEILLLFRLESNSNLRGYLDYL